jgi:type IV secretory pathway VirB4 component
VLGVSGAGMSITDKFIALMEEYTKGSRIIFIDPMSEYKNLCENFDRDFINADGGGNYLDNSDQHLSPEKEVPTWK